MCTTSATEGMLVYLLQPCRLIHAEIFFCIIVYGNSLVHCAQMDMLKRAPHTVFTSGGICIETCFKMRPVFLNFFFFFFFAEALYLPRFNSNIFASLFLPRLVTFHLGQNNLPAQLDPKSSIHFQHHCTFF